MGGSVEFVEECVDFRHVLTPDLHPVVDRPYPAELLHRERDLPGMTVDMDELGARQSFANEAQARSGLRRMRRRPGAAGERRRIAIGRVLVAPDRLRNLQLLAIELFDPGASMRSRVTLEAAEAPAIQEVRSPAAVLDQILQQHENSALIGEPDQWMLI